MTFKTAFRELDRIRNDRSHSNGELLVRVNSVGAWAAMRLGKSTQANKLLTECHMLADRLQGGSGKAGIRIELKK